MTMDEMTALREAWGDPQAPSEEARAQARTALLCRAADPAARRSRSPHLRGRGLRLGIPLSVRIAAVGTLAAAMAIGVTVVQTSGGTDKHGRPRSALPGLPAGSVAAASVVLDRAATAAEQRSSPAPRPGQWVYAKLRQTGPAVPAGITTGGPYETRTWELWRRADGKRFAAYQNGRLHISDESAAPVRSARYEPLPADPAALLRKVGGGREPGNEMAYETLITILRDSVHPPKTEAVIFRALKLIPGVSVVHDRADAAGRPAIAVGRVSGDGLVHLEVLIDPKTYAYLGERSITIRDHTTGSAGEPTITVKKGTLQYLTVRVGAGIVDEPGRRPA